MHTDPTDPPHPYDSPEYAAKVEAELTALQNRHRLAIHQWEDATHFKYPTELEVLLNTPAEDIAKYLGRGNKNGCEPPLFSMTLLPSRNSGRSVIPWEVSPSTLPNCGYLFTLDETLEHPAKVVRAAVLNINSGDDYNKKRLKLDPSSEYDMWHEISEIRKIYRKYDYMEGPLKRAVAKDHSISNLQLDYLGNAIDSTRTRKTFEEILKKIEKDPNILAHNEILTAASNKHVSAIYVPVYDYHHNTSDTERFDWTYGYTSLECTVQERQHLRELIGAVAGIQHLNKGTDLPVVFYQVNGAKKGCIRYFCQGSDMLNEKAYVAIHALQKSGFFQNHQHDTRELRALNAVIKNLFHIDISKPIEQQHAYQNCPNAHVSGAQHHGITDDQIRRAIITGWPNF